MGKGGREGEREGVVARWDICNSVSASLHVRFLHDVSSFIIPLDVSSRDDSGGGGGGGGSKFNPLTENGKNSSGTLLVGGTSTIGRKQAE